MIVSSTLMDLIWSFSAFKGRELFIVGYDATEFGLKAVKEGEIDATISQEPYEMR
ncbi:MAG: hypothetical protein RDV48_29170 [Candidatus Eremiobacteraeota bacterium]|nr:hypothetical protein [Candidatus Eremiobacteraeota bacterium]